MEEEYLYKILKKEPKEGSTKEHAPMPCEKYGKGFKILQKFVYDGKIPLGLQNKGIVQPLQPEIGFKKQHTKGLGFIPIKSSERRTKEAL